MPTQTKPPTPACSAAAWIAALSLGGLAAPVLAATPVGDYLTIGGFGTLGGVVTNSDEGQYGRDRQNGGADKHPTLDVDSNLGVQLDGKATSWLSGTVQALAAKRDDQGFTTRIEWAYVLVKPLDGLSVRGGRMAAPSFLVSESRNIGYANNWVRAPNEVYGLNFFHNFDGADVSYRRAFGSSAINVKALAGKTSFLTNSHKADVANVRGANLEIETDWATFRAGRVQGKVTIRDVGVRDVYYGFTGYGVFVDRNDIVAQAEFVQRRAGSDSGAGVNANGWYVMGGYRFGAFLPYAIVARTAPIVPDSPFHLSGTQSSTALGLRWDAFKSADLKFQVDRVDTHHSPGISFTTPVGAPIFPGGPTPSSPVDGKVTVFSVAMDFTF